MKIAIIGSRGYLANYGGYETFVRQLIDGLDHNEFEFVVYGISAYRSSDKDTGYAHVKPVWLPTLPFKSLQKVVASCIAVLHACLSGCNAILAVGVSPGLILFLPRLMGRRIVLNTDGIEWRRSKWSGLSA